MNNFCLHDQTVCPAGRHVFYKYDSIIECQGRVIPVLAALNSVDGIVKVTAPAWCPKSKARSIKATAKVVDVHPQQESQYSVASGKPRPLTKADKDEIKRRLAQGETISLLAVEYQVPYGQIETLKRKKKKKAV